MGKRIIRLKAPMEISALEKLTLLEVDVVLTNNAVWHGRVRGVSEQEIAVKNLRGKTRRIPLEEVREVIYDEVTNHA